MELYTIIFRTLFIYFLIIVVFRMMGKREIGKLSVIDFVVSIMIAELAVISIEDPEAPMINSLISILVLFGIQLILAVISLKSRKMREIVDGKPSIIIKEGKVDEEEMRKQRYNFDDLLTQLRENNIRSLNEVEFGVLETTGKLSVIRRDDDFERSPLQMILPLVLDGKMIEDNLQKVDKTAFWLRQELKKAGFKEIKNISFCTLNADGSLYVDEKNEKK
ncbi:DUF421 domain-containing protein [Fictibacillus phosphorivorans]|uniref:DUF421 domain-containing protein n=1 Tax=Fictibacillus phosphorivorans TaxID=1221500 RepID=UPI00203F93D8|nr:DUF421 domain-containing protein [Fictibacillus phosphorivorans]MCM3716983.1 DUF421 domain-containing protein [Fictibacillus phosphorivorans]MCM3774468.1 DUF421 domain-containing protein [Fictibacillus phosphorivorans]